MPFSLRTFRARRGGASGRGLRRLRRRRQYQPPATPPAPTGLAAVLSSDGSTIEVTWNAVTGATGYILERAEELRREPSTQVGGDLTDRL